MQATEPIPTIYFPRRGDAPPDPVPFLLTDADLIRLLRLDETDTRDLERTLARYRKEGLLKGTQVGTRIRYRLPDVLAFLSNAQEFNPR